MGYGDILKTLNGGITWTLDSSGTWNTLNSVFFTDSTTGYIVGLAGTILKTGNGGTDYVEEHKTISDRLPSGQTRQKTSAKCNVQNAILITLKFSI